MKFIAVAAGIIFGLYLICMLYFAGSSLLMPLVIFNQYDCEKPRGEVSIAAALTQIVNYELGLHHEEHYAQHTIVDDTKILEYEVYWFKHKYAHEYVTYLAVSEDNSVATGTAIVQCQEINAGSYRLNFQ